MDIVKLSLFGGGNMSERLRGTLGLLKGNLGIMCLSSGLWRLAGALTWPFFSLYLLGLGATYFHVGLVLAVGSICSIVPLFFGGYLADIIGRKRLIVTMSFLMSGMYIIYSQAPVWEYILAAEILNGLFSGLREPAFSALIADSTRPRNRALAYVIWERIPEIFAILSPTIAGICIDQYGVVSAMRWFYLAVFAMSFTASVIRFKFLDEAFLRQLPEQASVMRGFTAPIRQIRESVKVVPRQIWIITIISFVSSLGFAMTDPFWVTYAVEDVMGLKASEWGFISTTLIILGIVFSIPCGMASDRYGRLSLIIPSMFLSSATIALFPFCSGFTQVILVRSILDLSIYSLYVPARSALATDYSPKMHRGRITAMTMIVNSPWPVLGNLLGGYFYQNVSKQLPFILFSVLAGLTAILFLLFAKEPTKRED